MHVVMIGRAKIRVEAQGCMGCGTQYAPGWRPGRTVQVTVNGRRLEVAVALCSECSAKGKGVA